MIGTRLTSVELISAAGEIGHRALFARSDGGHIPAAISTLGNSGKEIVEAPIFRTGTLPAPAQSHIKQLLGHYGFVGIPDNIPVAFRIAYHKVALKGDLCCLTLRQMPQVNDVF